MCEPPSCRHLRCRTNRLCVSNTTCIAGQVPGLVEGNEREPLMPWSDPHNGRVVLGATVEEACAGPGQLKEALTRFAGAVGAGLVSD